MGFTVKFNWVLQIQPPTTLKVKDSVSFEKSGNRVFPLNTPIDLIDRDRTAVARIEVKSFTNEDGATTGIYEIVKIYSGEEKQVLTNYWKENQ